MTESAGNPLNFLSNRLLPPHLVDDDGSPERGIDEFAPPKNRARVARAKACRPDTACATNRTTWTT